MHAPLENIFQSSLFKTVPGCSARPAFLFFLCFPSFDALGRLPYFDHLFHPCLPSFRPADCGLEIEDTIKVDTVGTMTTLTCQTLVKKGSKQKALDEYHRDLEVFYRGKNQSRLHFCVNKCPAFSQREGSGSMLVSSAIWVFLF